MEKAKQTAKKAVKPNKTIVLKPIKVDN